MLAIGPEVGEWLQQATLAIRAHVSIDVISDTIQPFPSLSAIYDAAVMTLRTETWTGRSPSDRSSDKWRASRREEES